MKTIKLIIPVIAFLVLVTNVSAQLTSVMNLAPTITTQPVGPAICENGNTVLAIDATCVGGITLQSYVDAGSGYVAIVDDATYTGSSTDSLFITGAGIFMDGYDYQYIVTSVVGACVTTSDTATLNINPLATITVQPVLTSVCEDGNTSYTITADAVGGVSFQWEVDSSGGFTPLANGGYYLGVTTNTLTLTGVDMTLDNYFYRCVVTTTIGSCDLNSSSAELIINPLATISVQPADDNVCENGDASYTTTASIPTGTLSYQWREDDGFGFVNVTDGGIYSGATTSAFTLTGVTSAMDGYDYQCIITTSIGSCALTSSSATLTVNPLATITVQPVADAACDSANASFGVTAVGGVTYQWQENSGSGWINLSDGGIYSGTATANLALTGVTFPMNGYPYRCVITTVVGSCDLNSSSATLTVTALPLTQSPTANGVGGTTGSYCPAELGTIFGLTSSQAGFDYELQDFTLSTTIENITGTGSSISFTAQPFGTYKIEITGGGCITIIQ